MRLKDGTLVHKVYKDKYGDILIGTKEKGARGVNQCLLSSKVNKIVDNWDFTGNKFGMVYYWITKKDLYQYELDDIFDDCTGVYNDTFDKAIKETKETLLRDINDGTEDGEYFEIEVGTCPDDLKIVEFTLVNIYPKVPEKGEVIFCTGDSYSTGTVLLEDIQAYTTTNFSDINAITINQKDVTFRYCGTTIPNLNSNHCDSILNSIQKGEYSSNLTSGGINIKWELKQEIIDIIEEKKNKTEEKEPSLSDILNLHFKNK